MDGESIHYRNINLSKMTNRILAITVSKLEILQLCPNTIIIQSRSRHNTSTKLRLGNTGSGIILLFLAIQPTTMRKYDFPIDINFSRILRATKANIMKKGASNHYNSTGKYYSFGNKGSYKKLEIRQWANISVNEAHPRTKR